MRRRGSSVSSAARTKSRPPSASTSAKRSSLWARRPASAQAQYCTGLSRKRITDTPLNQRLNMQTGDLPMPAAGRSSGQAANLLVGLAGLLLMVLAALAGHGWADRHFLPSFAFSRAFQLGLVDGLRLALGLLGLLLMLVVRPRVVRSVREG